METQVLIVGAGPTGLVLALWLQRFGVKVRVIDKTKEPGTTSRALVVHARTLEFYQQMGLADEVVDRGLKFVEVNLWINAQKVAKIEIGEMGKGLSPFPHLIIFPQDEHERFLIEHLHKVGVEVERETELVGFTQNERGVEAELQRADGRSEKLCVDYIAGCDGARSKVREVVGSGFSGSTYTHLFYVADAEATGPIVDKALHIAIDTADFLAAFPLKGDKRVRLIGTIEDQLATKKDLNWDDVSHFTMNELKVDVKKVNWFSTYHVHHRVADHFHYGRAFLLGDAAHIHSPVGGQGMNTGIGDSVNLAWKLAAVLQKRAKPELLDTFEVERIAFARRLVATTDQAFIAVTSKTRFARFTRRRLIPLILPRLARLRAFRKFMFLTISQIAIEYQNSALSSGQAGRLKAGDRLPWLADNFEPLIHLEWQVHVYGHAAPSLKQECAELSLGLHIFPWKGRAHRAGFVRNAIYLVRPDGYLGFIGNPDDTPALKKYCADHGLKF